MAAEASRRFDHLTVQYSHNMNYLRELINHTFLRAIYHTSSKQAKLEFKEVRRIYHNNEAEALLQNGNHVTVKFTAQHIIDHVEAHCTYAHALMIERYKRYKLQTTIDKKIRYNGQSLLDWYQVFIPIVNKYQKAAGKANLNADEQKAVWKDHFVKQVNLAELVLMISVRAIHLTANEVTSITKFNEDEFADAALLKLLSKINVSFERYEPDKAVVTYLHQHARTLNFEFDFKNSKEHANERESRSKERNSNSQSSSNRKRGRSRNDRDKRSHNPRHKSTKTRDTGTSSNVPNNQHCRRSTCIQRDTNANHTHDK